MRGKATHISVILNRWGSMQAKGDEKGYGFRRVRATSYDRNPRGVKLAFELLSFRVAN